MDSVLFYVPPSVPASQPPRSSGVRAAFLPAVAPFPSFTITSNSARQTAAQRSNQNETWKDFPMVEHVDMSNPALPGHLSKQRTCRDDLVQVQENSTAAQNFSHLNEDGEDDDFPTVEQFLSSRRQDSISASAKPITANMSEEVNGRTQDSPTDSSHSTAGTTHDPIILSDDEPEGAESETDYSDLDFDLNLDLNLIAKNDPRSADPPRPASPRSSTATYQASKLRLNTEGTKRSMDHIDNAVFGQLEDDAFDVFAGDDNRDSDDAHSTKRQKLTTISLRDPTSNSAIPGLHNSRRDYTQSPLESTDLEEPPSGSLVTEPNQEWEIGNILSQKTVVGKSTGDPNNEDSPCRIDATGSNIEDLPRPLKRVRCAKDKEDPANTTLDDVGEDSPTSSVDVPSRATAATMSGAVQESEEIAVHGYLTLKTLQSKVLYCLTFSQESLPRPLEKEQQQDVFIDQSEGIGLDAEPNQEWAVRNIIGQKMIDEEMHYQVVWEPTWVPESELAGAKELVDGFVAKFQHLQGGIGAGRGKQAPRAAATTSRQPDARGKAGPQKRRGRPRKQK